MAKNQRTSRWAPCHPLQVLKKQNKTKQNKQTKKRCSLKVHHTRVSMLFGSEKAICLPLFAGVQYRSWWIYSTKTFFQSNLTFPLSTKYFPYLGIFEPSSFINESEEHTRRLQEVCGDPVLVEPCRWLTYRSNAPKVTTWDRLALVDWRWWV